MIKAITFDLDGVYFPNGKKNFMEALVTHGVSEDEAKRVFLKSGEMNRLYKRGKMSDDGFWSWAAAQWKIKLTPKELVGLLIFGYDVDERVVLTINNLRKNGYKTLVCSNNFPARVNGLNERFQFLNNFDAAVFSYEVGELKPSEAIFQELIGRSRVKAGEIVFSDDNPDNLVGAMNLGITTFLYEGFDKFISKLQSLGVNV